MNLSNEILRDELDPTKKDNLIIIFTFALAVLILILYFVTLFISILIFILDLVLWGITFMMIFWKINRLLRKLGLFGGYMRYNDF